MAWAEIPHGQKTNGLTFIAVSDTGMLLRKNGEVVPSKYRQKIGGSWKRIYQLVAENFLITVHRPDQTHIDHITHNPEGMNINDVRNLRFCTQKENNNFTEALGNKHKPHGGNSNWKKGLTGFTTWNKGLSGEEYKKHFKNGVKNKYTKGA